MQYRRAPSQYTLEHPERPPRTTLDLPEPRELRSDDIGRCTLGRLNGLPPAKKLMQSAYGVALKYGGDITRIRCKQFLRTAYISPTTDQWQQNTRLQYLLSLLTLRLILSTVTATMSFFEPPPKPKTALGYHRILSPSASVKVSPIALGGISIGSSWGEIFGKNEEPFDLLDAYFSLGGNFIDTANTYNSEDSERLIGDWMQQRGTRDQMVIATKYTAGYQAYNRDKLPLQSNFTGNSAKSMHISVRDSLRKLKTDYIDILYVHWSVRVPFKIAFH